MEIRINNNSYNNFSSRKLFNTTLFKKAADGVAKPVKAFISELTFDDFSRADLSMESWKSTDFGMDILKDFGEKCIVQKQPWLKNAQDELDAMRFFAVEVPTGKTETKAIALGEAKVRDEFIVLDRLQALNKKDEAGRFTGGGSNILYLFAKLAQKMEKFMVTLESHKNAIDFYKKSGMQYEPRGDFSFFRLYQPCYDDFLKNLEKKFNITPIVE